MRVLSIDCGIKNLAYCILSLNTGLEYSIEQWNVVDVLDTSNINHKKKPDFYLTSERLVEMLYDTFSIDADFSGFDYVLIENQPVQKNPVMKSIQMIIYTFFLMMRHQFGHETIIRLVSATNKLKVLKRPLVTSTKITECKNEYKKKKLMAVELCTHYLKEVMKDEANLEKISTCNKKDDYADCFLQGVQFIEKNLASTSGKK